MKIKTPQTISNIDTLEDLTRYTSQSVQAITDSINGNLSFSDNLSTSIITATFEKSGSKTFNHGLGQVPVGYIVIGKNVNVQVWDGTDAATKTTISLSSAGQVTATVMVIG